MFDLLPRVWAHRVSYFKFDLKPFGCFLGSSLVSWKTWTPGFIDQFSSKIRKWIKCPGNIREVWKSVKFLLSYPLSALYKCINISALDAVSASIDGSACCVLKPVVDRWTLFPGRARLEFIISYIATPLTPKWTTLVTCSIKYGNRMGLMLQLECGLHRIFFSYRSMWAFLF